MGQHSDMDEPRDVRIEAEDARDGRAVTLPGDLTVPDAARGIVLFAHGSGSTRRSPRNVRVATLLNRAGLATLLFDLLTPGEAGDRSLVFVIPLLAGRLLDAMRTVCEESGGAGLPMCHFGGCNRGGAARCAAAQL